MSDLNAVSDLNPGYAGDVSADEAFKILQTQRNSFLIDVRTHAEWHFVGVPDLQILEKEVIFLEWKNFPQGEVADDFADTLKAHLKDKQAAQDSPLYFLCRSGVRSQAAAIAMTQAGFTHCYNVSGGFEGDLDANRHRNRINGWRKSDLPWLQQ